MKIPHDTNSIYIPFLSLSAISFTIGILCGFFIALPFVVSYCCALSLVLLLICLQRKGMRTDSLILLVFFLIGMLHQRNRAILPPNDIYYCTGPGANKVTVQGFVTSHVQESPYDKSFMLHPRHLIRLSRRGERSLAPTLNRPNAPTDLHGVVGGKLLVRFNKRVDIEFGEHLKIEGTLSALKDSGYFNQRLIRQGIRSVLYVRRGDWITKERRAGASIQRLAFFTV